MSRDGRRRLEGAAWLTAMAASSPFWFFASAEVQLASVGVGAAAVGLLLGWRRRLGRVGRDRGDG